MVKSFIFIINLYCEIRMWLSFNQRILYLFTATNGSDNVLQEMLGCQNTDYSTITFVCPDVEAYSKKITSSTNNVYFFQLTDEDGVEINLNGQNIVFTLMFKKDPVYKNINQFLNRALMKEIMA